MKSSVLKLLLSLTVILSVSVTSSRAALDEKTRAFVSSKLDSLQMWLNLLRVEERLIAIWGSGVTIPDSTYEAMLFGLTEEQKLEILELRKRIFEQMESYEIERLGKKRAMLEEEVKIVEEDIKSLAPIEIETLEKFIERYGSAKEYMDLINTAKFKLANLYFNQVDEPYSEAMERYNNEMERYEAGLIPFPPKEPKRDFSKPLDLYIDIVKTSSDLDILPYSLYTISWFFINEGKQEEGLKFLKTLVEAFPSDSVNAPDAYKMIGDYYFNHMEIPGNEELQLAIENYGKILQFWNSPRYQEALYLLGWCYYRIDDYMKAVAYFTLLVDEIEWARGLGEEAAVAREKIRDDFRPEAIEYIGISFFNAEQEGMIGLDSQISYFKKLGDKSYSPEILSKLGEIYLEVGNRQIPEFLAKSSTIYSDMLSAFPNYAGAPKVYKQLAMNRFYGMDKNGGYQAYEELFSKYNRNGTWTKNSKLSKAEIAEADSLAAYAILEAAKYSFEKAKEMGNDPEMLLEAVRRFEMYLGSYRYINNEAYDINYNLAIIYEQMLQDYEKAYQEYIRVSKDYKQDKYRGKAALQAILVAQKLLELEKEAAEEEAAPVME